MPASPRQIANAETDLVQVRCRSCRRLLAELSVGAAVRTKCPRCHAMVVTVVKPG